MKSKSLNRPLYRPYYYYNRGQLNRVMITSHTIYHEEDLCCLTLSQFLDRLALVPAYSPYFELWNSPYPESDKVGQAFVKRIINDYHLTINHQPSKL